MNLGPWIASPWREIADEVVDLIGLGYVSRGIEPLDRDKNG